MTKLEKYYNKFNEDHRLTTRHGLVEFTTTYKYILECLEKVKNQNCDKIFDKTDFQNAQNIVTENFVSTSSARCENFVENSSIKILDVGAGTGRYSVALSQEGYDVTAVELVRHNLDVLQSKRANVKCWQGNALDLSFLPENKFDVTLIFGPLYHLMSKEEKLQAFNEARRVTKNGGYILAAYVMNDYSVISYCFKQNKIKECVERASLTEDFHQIPTEDDLYCYLRLEDINELNQLTGLKREKIIAADGAADYIRRELNALDQESFDWFIKYHLANCERPELLGASSHLVDILKCIK